MTEKMLFIGDIHGLWENYARILEVYRPEHSVQVGDFGIGFHREDPARLEQVRYAMDNFGPDNRYIRGNHDNPAACRADPRCIPDATFDAERGIFYMGGALSIDNAFRTPGLSWWEDEELSMDELYAAMDVYEAAKPRIVVTHECPESVVPYMFNWYKTEWPSRTRQALDSMLALHRPELWVFGHWHGSRDDVRDGTRFICLNELEAVLVDI